MVPDIVIGGSIDPVWPREFKKLKLAWERKCALCFEAPIEWQKSAWFWIDTWTKVLYKRYPNGF